MLRIGIVGAENSHSAAIAKTINVRRAIRGAKVVALWGETAAFADKTAKVGKIPTIVKRPADMVGMIDGVMIDHRHAKYHLPAAEPFLKARIPMFIDKPFCYRVAEGRAFLRRARRAGVPVTSFSTVSMSKSFGQLKRQVARFGTVSSLSTAGPCDIRSKYGGVFFYGIHQVAAVISLLGTNVTSAQVHVFGGKNHTATLEYGDGPLVTMNFRDSWDGGWQYFVGGPKGAFSHVGQGDADPYLTGARTFVRMFRTGVEPYTHDEILAPVRVLEALEKSIKSGRREKV